MSVQWIQPHAMEYTNAMEYTECNGCELVGIPAKAWAKAEKQGSFGFQNDRFEEASAGTETSVNALALECAGTLQPLL